jgi:hypothetical protein
MMHDLNGSTRRCTSPAAHLVQALDRLPRALAWRN